MEMTMRYTPLLITESHYAVFPVYPAEPQTKILHLSCGSDCLRSALSQLIHMLLAAFHTAAVQVAECAEVPNHSVCLHTHWSGNKSRYI